MALCETERWGDGSAVRSYTHVNDMVDDLARAVAKTAGKKIEIKHVKGPVGVQSHNFSNERIYSLGWKP